MLSQAREVYTKAIFEEFQEQFVEAIELVTTNCVKDDGKLFYTVDTENSSKKRQVIRESDDSLSCSWYRTQAILSYHQRPSTSSPFHLKGIISSEGKMKRNSRRLMIGSTAPTCTYNECRGCKYKCRAEQVPVEGNDPINSAYHYKCVCHR
ncbi:hypothetical protein EZV62_019511 [Acer yangbiense]|uniref:Stomagen C-terminal domain-containing protein n=1 Tax=Acer yangbiense TaxID=1000413 RepID=A0A5C7HCG5_9ROSI|nr:hypothetical protein EZV62_019511 [Acer yangbiense]